MDMKTVGSQTPIHPMPAVVHRWKLQDAPTVPAASEDVTDTACGEIIQMSQHQSDQEKLHVHIYDISATDLPADVQEQSFTGSGVEDLEMPIQCQLSVTIRVLKALQALRVEKGLATYSQIIDFLLGHYENTTSGHPHCVKCKAALDLEIYCENCMKREGGRSESLPSVNSVAVISSGTGTLPLDSITCAPTEGGRTGDVVYRDANVSSSSGEANVSSSAVNFETRYIGEKQPAVPDSAESFQDGGGVGGTKTVAKRRPRLTQKMAIWRQDSRRKSQVQSYPVSASSKKKTAQASSETSEQYTAAKKLLALSESVAEDKRKRETEGRKQETKSGASKDTTQVTNRTSQRRSSRRQQAKTGKSVTRTQQVFPDSEDSMTETDNAVTGIVAELKEGEEEGDLSDSVRDKADSNEPLDPKAVRLLKRGKPYKCTHCGEAYAFLKEYFQHVMEMCEGRYSYRCRHCQAMFLNHCEARKHSEVYLAERPFKCDQCPRTFASHLNYKQHMRLHKNLRFLCPLCGKSFVNQSNFNAHKKTHEEGSCFQCTVCGVALRTKRILETHIQKVHERAATYKCHLCPRAFTRCGSLSVHIRSHTGEKPAFCPFCPSKFMDRSGLRKHLMKVHGTGITKVPSKLTNRQSAYLSTESELAVAQEFIVKVE